MKMDASLARNDSLHKNNEITILKKRRNWRQGPSYSQPDI